MYNTLLEMGFRGELNELIDSRQHTAIFTALDKTAGFRPKKTLLYHVSSHPKLRNAKVGDKLTFRPGSQNAEGLGVYFSEKAPRLTAAEGSWDKRTGQTHRSGIIQIEASSPSDWWRTKNSVVRKFNRPRTWHTKGKSLDFTVTDVGNEGVIKGTWEWTKTAEAIYHGSNRRVRKLKPKESPLTDKPVVYGTPNRSMALTFMGKWTDDDLELGRVNDGPMTLREKYPGALEKIYRRKRGYLYTLDDKGFRSQKNLMRSERVTEKSPKILKRERITDILQALEDSDIRLVRARDKSPHVDLRMRERAPSAGRDLRKLRRALRKKKLKRGQTYYAPVTGGYAVIGDVGRRQRRHVVKTVLSPEMKPPGLPLYGLTKESVDKQALKEAIIAAGTTIPSKEHLKNYPHHAALNLGQAAFYASKIRKEPKLTADMMEQILYAVLPPTHHTKKEIENMRRKGGLRYWYKQGRG
ncbi:MAG: hypothetical protein CMH53_09025 [Myxococcales bacterium]|nr:hypothetical protein [Myxococcales bacterium]